MHLCLGQPQGKRQLAGTAQLGALGTNDQLLAGAGEVDHGDALEQPGLAVLLDLQAQARHQRHRLPRRDAQALDPLLLGEGKGLPVLALVQRYQHAGTDKQHQGDHEATASDNTGVDPRCAARSTQQQRGSGLVALDTGEDDRNAEGQGCHQLGHFRHDQQDQAAKFRQRHARAQHLIGQPRRLR